MIINAWSDKYQRPGTASVKGRERQVLKAESGKSDKQETGIVYEANYYRGLNYFCDFFWRHTKSGLKS